MAGGEAPTMCVAKAVISKDATPSRSSNPPNGNLNLQKRGRARRTVELRSRGSATVRRPWKECEQLSRSTTKRSPRRQTWLSHSVTGGAGSKELAAKHVHNQCS